MPDWLRRSLAPLTDEAWQEVEEAATEVLRDQMSARAVVDVDGPHGFDYAALNLGRLEIGKKDAGIPYGIRQVQPLVELRIPVLLDQMSLDSISRGSQDVDLGPLEEAARKLAEFEETAIYQGFDPGGIKGIGKAASHKAADWPEDAEKCPSAVAGAIERISEAGVGGPYALVLGRAEYFGLMAAGRGGYPPRRIVGDLVGGGIHWSPALKGGLVLSTRGGDFELVLGQDAAIGYAHHDRDKVELYLVESFTFRVLEPAAAMVLKSGG